MIASPHRRAGRAAGESRRDAAHALLSARRASIVRQAQRSLIAALLAMNSATADDVRDLVDVPAGVDPVCLGAAPGPLARAGIIERIGWEASCRPIAHARPVSRWRLIDRAGAVRWLAAHPPIPNPAPDAASSAASSATLWTD